MRRLVASLTLVVAALLTGHSLAAHRSLGPPFPGTDRRQLHPSIEDVIHEWADFDG